MTEDSPESPREDDGDRGTAGKADKKAAREKAAREKAASEKAARKKAEREKDIRKLWPEADAIDAWRSLVKQLKVDGAQGLTTVPWINARSSIRFSDSEIEVPLWATSITDDVAQVTLKSLDKIRKLENSLRDQQVRAVELQQELHRTKAENEARDEIEAELTELMVRYKREAGLQTFLRRVRADVGNQLLDEKAPLEAFLDAVNNDCESFIVSIDLRRSTDLMLKARSPREFADFIVDVADNLGKVIKSHYGVVDKFTGDGILAFFPSFYSNPDSGMRAVSAAHECHRVFAEIYRKNRSSFDAVLKNVGLGIGIDYGTVRLVEMPPELTVVGTPVVYACRLGGANAGVTLVNQPAYELLLHRYAEFLQFEETEIDFKHEGRMVAYSVSPNERAWYEPNPEWMASDATPNVDE